MSFHKYIKQARIEVGLTQRDVSNKFKWGSPQFVSNWESDKSLPPRHLISKLAVLYKINPDKLEQMIYEESLKRFKQKWGR